MTLHRSKKAMSQCFSVPYANEFPRLPLHTMLGSTIIGRLFAWHLRQARLVCKAFAYVSGPCLFRRIYISPLPKDIEVFRYLTNHEVFSKYIEEIVCDDSVFPETYLELPSWDEWWAADPDLTWQQNGTKICP